MNQGGRSGRVADAPFARIDGPVRAGSRRGADAPPSVTSRSVIRGSGGRLATTGPGGGPRKAAAAHGSDHGGTTTTGRLGVAAAASIGAGVIHAAAIGVHAENVGLSRLFIAAAIFQIGWGALRARPPATLGRTGRRDRQPGHRRWLARDPRRRHLLDRRARGARGTGVRRHRLRRARPGRRRRRPGRLAGGRPPVQVPRMALSALAISALAIPAVFAVSSHSHGEAGHTHGTETADGAVAAVATEDGHDHTHTEEAAATSHRDDRGRRALPRRRRAPTPRPRRPSHRYHRHDGRRPRARGGGRPGAVRPEPADRPRRRRGRHARAAGPGREPGRDHADRAAPVRRPGPRRVAGLPLDRRRADRPRALHQLELRQRRARPRPRPPRDARVRGRRGGPTLVSAMFIATGAVDYPELVDYGGPFMQWHVHDNLCWGVEDGSPGRVGVMDANGNCAPGSIHAGGDNPMVHVWIYPATSAVRSRHWRVTAPVKPPATGRGPTNARTRSRRARRGGRPRCGCPAAAPAARQSRTIRPSRSTSPESRA